MKPPVDSSMNLDSQGSAPAPVRIQGSKQTSKPMIIKKKKMVMDVPDPKQSGLTGKPVDKFGGGTPMQD